MIADNTDDIRKALEAIQSDRARAKIEAAQREAEADKAAGNAKAQAELGGGRTKTDGDEQLFRGFFLTEDGDIRPTQ